MDPTIERRRQELKQKADDAATLEKLIARFPDLKIHTNRWEQKRYTSAEANAQCTDYDLAHNCGCCNDSPLELWPYMEFEGAKIYAAGVPFTIGEKYYWLGEDPYTGWDSQLRNVRIPEAIIAKIETYFAENPPQNRDEDDDE